MFEKIVLPVDLTDKTKPAIQAAMQFALQHGSTVTLLHVIEMLDAPMEEMEDFYNEIEAKAKVTMRELSAPLRDAGIAVDHHIQYGKRVPSITKFTNESGADLVILSSHRIDPDDPSRTWMTISHQLAMLISVPVLMVK